ncbi:hypothetical protein ST47_g5195 [Ascochyta rabiei]|uniref:Heterokaryon incompatibility domain-containing protein n=1 Tax=Didymella rabiei TaxID=5454 RepID=A0A162YQH3_DIDRA|nr:hypothetical protein ST47_g8710 [Ascochyta rabiei]KZM23707.1 hypothetical protein ST47_g5195 [Ascochyta rabiei]
MTSTPLDAQRRLYQPLRGSSIRLLSIKPGFPSEDIECGFVTVSDLHESPSYDALSYVWGEELHADPIICNGVETVITKQLADALTHLRRFPGSGSASPWDKDHPLLSSKNAWNGFARNRHEHYEESVEAHEALLWVDALCINQKDGDERANQVKMMGQIYARAQNVKIWLGKEHKEPPAFVASLGIQRAGLQSNAHIGTYGGIPIALSFIAQALRNAKGPRNRLAAIKPTGDSAHRNIAYGFPPPDAPEWDVVRNFFTNAWFERVWVVQEAVLASKATVLIGDWEIEWAAIGQAAVWFRSKGYAIPTVLKYQLRDQQDLLPVSKSASVWMLCLWPSNKVPLLDLLREFRTRKATNPVDKVYATFGMADELQLMDKHGFHGLVEPDYLSKTVLDVYRDIAKFLIIEHGNLDVLSEAETTSSMSGWPSWVPDWRYEKASNALLTRQTAGIYNASNELPLAIGISNNVNALTLQGLEVDVIMAYGERLASYGFGAVTYQEELDFVRAAWTLLVRRPTNKSCQFEAGDLAGAFIQTLTTGVNNAYRPIHEDPSFLDDALYWFTQHAPKTIPSVPFSQRLKWKMQRTPDSGRFHEAFVRACVDRRFFVTKNGSMGIGSNALKEGDVVVVLFGGNVPYLLRPVDSGYKFLGECYVPGLMDGEAAVPWRQAGSKRTFFELA